MTTEGRGLSTGDRWRVDLAPCDPKVRLCFHRVEAELDYDDAERIAEALLAAVAASRARWNETAPARVPTGDSAP